MQTTPTTVERRPVFCVLGAGHGGMAMAGHLALKGFTVHLYNRSPERLVPVQQSGGIQVLSRDTDAIPHGAAPIALATSAALLLWSATGAADWYKLAATSAVPSFRVKRYVRSSGSTSFIPAIHRPSAPLIAAARADTYVSF